MGNFKKVFGGYFSVALGAMAPYIVDGLHAVVSNIPETGRVSTVIKLVAGAALAAIGARILHKADPGTLQPTPGIPDDGRGPEAGKAAGEAAAKASRGPFKPAA